MSCTYSYEQSRFLSRCEKEIPRLASELHDLRQGLREVIKNSYDTRSEIFHNITSALDRIARVEHIWVSLIATYARGSGLLGKRYPTTVNFNWGEQLILATKEGQADVNSISDYLQEDFRDFVESELESNDDVNGEVIESISGGLFALGDLHSQLRSVLEMWQDGMNHKNCWVLSAWISDIAQILEQGLEILAS